MSARVFTPTHVIASGWGFDVGANFERARADIPVALAASEYAKPQHVIAYDQGGKRMHVQRRALKELNT